MMRCVDCAEKVTRQCEGKIIIMGLVSCWACLARKFRREIQSTKVRHKGLSINNYFRQFGFIVMRKFLDQGEGQDESINTTNEKSVLLMRSPAV
jgi:hypothetical protein